MQPFLRGRAGRNARRMNVKTFRAAREHASRGPLFRPEPNPGQNSLIAPGEFAEDPAMPLGMNLPGKYLHTGNPNLFCVRFARIDGGQLPGLDSDFGNALGERPYFVIARSELRLDRKSVV